MLEGLLIRYLRGTEHPGKLRIVRWLGRHVIPDQGLVALVEPGVRLYLHPRDWIEYLLLRHGRYEPMTLDFLARNLAPGDRALLAGVNNGLHTIVAAQAVGPNGRVLGVEPQPASLLRARVNLELNGVADRVLLVAAALGDEPALLPMKWSSPENPGGVSLLDRGPGFTVTVITLAEILRELCGGPLRLLLLDVQGYETQALRGLDPGRLPDLVVVEDAPDFLTKVGVSRDAVYSQLTDLGYRLHDLNGSPVAAPCPLPELNLVGVRPGATVHWSPVEPELRDRLQRSETAGDRRP